MPFQILGQPYVTGNWSWKNIADNSSIVYLTASKPNASNPIGRAEGSIAFYFRGLPYLQAHGVNTITLPFTAGAPNAAYNYIVGKYPYFGSTDSTRLTIDFYIPGSDLVVSSSPSYSTIQPYVYQKAGQPYQLVRLFSKESGADPCSLDTPRDGDFCTPEQGGEL